MLPPAHLALPNLRTRVLAETGVASILNLSAGQQSSTEVTARHGTEAGDSGVREGQAGHDRVCGRGCCEPGDVRVMMRANNVLFLVV